jgi:hypothetical protein
MSGAMSSMDPRNDSEKRAGVRASLPYYPRPLTNDSRDQASHVSSQGHEASMALNPALFTIFVE